MELFVKYWKCMQNTENWEYLYWKTGEQLGGTDITKQDIIAS